MKKELHPGCPDDRVLQDVAAGVSTPEVERQTIGHVAQCGSCGPRFRGLLRIESKQPLSASEKAIYNQLKTSHPETQRRWLTEQGIIPKDGARKSDPREDMKGNSDAPAIASEPHHEIKWWPRLAYAGAALAAVIAGFVWAPGVLANMVYARADKQVGQAFAERRTIEARYSGAPAAPYRPYPVELGPDTPAVSDFDRPELAKAQGVVADKVKSGDPRWLQLQGRISLLKGDSRSLSDAEKMFEAASKKDPNSASLKIDLAATYFERDSKAEHPNLQKSLDLLLEVLHRPNLGSQDRATALFDLAIAYEKTQAWDMAVDTWNKYLEVDKSGPWAEQAREHLKEAEEKTRQKRQQGYDAPKNLLDQVAQGTLRPEEPEQYFQKALNIWLPKAVEDRDSEYYQATAQLGEILERQSSDTWLKDFLRLARARDATAVQALSAASAANEKGLYEAGAEQAHRALDAFRASKNTAGVEMARFQEVYATRSLLKGKDCLDLMGPLRSRLARSRHQWLRAQGHLEEAQCRNFQGQLAESDARADTSMEIAKTFHLPVLMLRNMGIVAGMKRQQGRFDQSWSKAVEGMGVYWKATYPADRLDQFYSVMFQDADKSGSSFVAEAILRNVLAMRESPVTVIQKNLLREATLHLYLANLLKARNEIGGAALEARKAASVLDSAAESAKALSLITNLGSAQHAPQLEEAKQALKSLLGMRSLLTSAQDKVITLSYYRLLGNTYLQLGQLDDAASAYQNAIKIAEGSLDTLRNESERVAWLRSTEGSYRGMVRVLVAQRNDRQALETWEWYESRAALQGHAALESSTNSKPSQNGISVQSLPFSQENRLVYASFQDGLQIWLVNGAEIRSKWVPVERSEFERSVRSFSEKCANAESSLQEIHEEGARLFAILLQPVVDQLSDGGNVIVELDRSAYNLPFEALRGPDGRYFGEKYSVIYSPGVWVEQSLRPAKAIAAEEPLLLLDASHGPQAGYLPGMDAERKKISGLFPRTSVVDSSSVSVRDFQARLATSEIFHFMGHGQQDGSGTHLVLNGKLTLGAKDFTPEFLRRSQLVVLSACSTGRGEKDGYLDTDSLVHSFLAAGVPSIVSSHWNVDSASSSRLMSSFYSHLVTDKTAAQAMYNARREMMGANAHPYYWAGFSVVGRAI